MDQFSSLRIGIDGFNLSLPRGTGVATYARNLTYALKFLSHDVDVLYGMDITEKMAPTLREVMFFDRLGGNVQPRSSSPLRPKWWKNTIQDAAGRTAVEVPMTGHVDRRIFVENLPQADRILNVWNLFHRAQAYYRLTGQFLRVNIPDPPAIMHWTYPFPISVNKSLNIYTIHDLVPLRLPTTTADNKKYYYNLIRDICRKQGPICTVSEASRQEINKFFPDSKANTYVAYPSVSDPNKNYTGSEYEKNELHNMFGISAGEYFIFIGALEPKKNIYRLVESFLSYNTSRKLLIVGAAGWKNRPIVRIIKKGVDAGRVVYSDYLPRPVLRFLLKNARALLFPSIAEGFGLPVLEAFQAGIPVMCSAEGGLKEVCGHAALIVDAFDTESIIRGISRMDNDDSLCNSLIKNGTEQAGQFSINKFADGISEMYRNTLRNHT